MTPSLHDIICFSIPSVRQRKWMRLCVWARIVVDCTVPETKHRACHSHDSTKRRMRELTYFCARHIQHSHWALMKSLCTYLFSGGKQRGQPQITYSSPVNRCHEQTCLRFSTDSKDQHKLWWVMSATYCVSSPPCLQAREVISIDTLPKLVKQPK